MRLEQLYYLCEIAKNKSISYTAELVHISQPALSSAIHKLELELGVKLLNRFRQGVYLTEEGEKVVKTATEVLAKIEELEHDLALSKEAKQNSVESLTLYTTQQLGNTILSKVLIHFHQEYPHIRLNLKETNSLRVISNFQADNCSLSFIAISDDILKKYSKTQGKGYNFNFEKLRNGKLYAVVGKNHPLNKFKNASLEEIVKYPIIIIENGCLPYAEMLKKYGDPDILVHSDIFASSSDFINKGFGVALASSFFIIPDTDFVYIPISNNIKVSLGLVWPENYNLDLIQQKFVNFCIEAFKKNKPTKNKN
ncbi:LysR family transcriptional regulator [Desulfosporosinus sp.]|uniref:LysR family transcriptional regulator n=1 Tax=Desulfosporosinus sp. TaxID=157907 RepID=UPI0025B843E9|nr:LysR family transcriptional regulator [Desulfosporosinus sp.]MBC2727712.1 LysR family transcriptional regulator [Desulfosporosinus sp.]